MRNNKKIKSLVFFSSIILILIIFLSRTGIFNNLFLSLDKNRKIYIEAKNYQNNEDFKSAYYTYNKISPGYPLYDIVLFQQAKCAASLEDEKTTIIKLKKLIFRFSNSPVIAQAEYKLGQAYIRTGKYKNAEKQFSRIIKKYPDTDYATASYYYLGQASKTKNKEMALKYWLNYINIAPDGRFSQDCIAEILSLNTKLDNIADKYIGIALFKNQKYDEALKYFNKIAISDCWYYKGKIYQATGENNKALDLFNQGISKYSSKVNKSEMQNAMLSYVNLDQKSKFASWSELIKISNKKYKDFALFNKAKLFPKSLRPEFYNQILADYPDSSFASESLWRLFWNEFSNKNYNKAIELSNSYKNVYSHTRMNSQILFWTGKAFERVNKPDIAAHYYKKILKQYPDSYYAFRSNSRLVAAKTGYDQSWEGKSYINISKLDEKPVSYSYSEISEKYGLKVAELIAVKDYDAVFDLMPEEDPFLTSWIELQQGYYTKSTVIARDGMDKLMPKPDINDKRWKLIYPVHFINYISKYADINKNNPVLLLSLIKEESHFNPLAISSSDARGLMQILPGTAKDISTWDNLGLANSFQLFNPEINIKIGSAYFKHTKSVLNNNSLFAVAAYNCGPGAVQEWLKTIPSSDLDEFVENIPYDQTKTYVKKIYKTYWNYMRIYVLNS